MEAADIWSTTSAPRAIPPAVIASSLDEVPFTFTRRWSAAFVEASMPPPEAVRDSIRLRGDADKIRRCEAVCLRQSCRSSSTRRHR